MPTCTRFKTPFKSLVTPATKAHRKDLAAQLKTEKQRDPIEVDDEGNVLHGHVRYAILGDDVAAVVKDGFQSEAEKRAYVYKCDGGTKPRTKEQERKRRAGLKAEAKILQGERLTQRQIADKLGVTQQTVSKWCSKNTTGCSPSSSGGSGSQSRNDAAARRAKVVSLLKAGTSTADIAKQVGLSERRVKAIRKEEGIEPPKKGLTEEQVEAIRQGVAAGRPNAHIAEEIGVCSTTVQKHITKLGLQRPKKKLGQMPKALSKRSLYCRDLMANGKPRVAALAQCDLTDNLFKRAARVAENGSALAVEKEGREGTQGRHRRREAAGQAEDFASTARANHRRLERLSKKHAGQGGLDS
jgi:predicted transcriptional regulator